MHIQARSGTKTTAMVDDDDDGVLINAEYGGGGLAQILAILEEDGFSLRGASGAKIELDGVFSWWVRQRFDDDGNPIDEDDDDATRKAIDIVNAAGFDTEEVEVSKDTDGKRRWAILGIETPTRPQFRATAALVVAHDDTVGISEDVRAVLGIEIGQKVWLSYG